ncbi:FadR/GntR family transcriptional regulator [Shimwellia blattae]|uniref:Putative galactonate operon transcriptional repressor n=1 Tax=Shimwellia blattae (strain ATCC 29907 / DSM 4481 / JCM 1650 / NBRC 105725 / CDC 9005-74) TaxID=630626 RepID=I2BCY4_SHIBC|nr:FadR/GntR family transcriptional regulator [Shimwellia blattae]AFJ48388.1 putative galactonate operon transcriptional repressor [Shimwellia blattae DSM 4481 = NBRC 105725]GAB81082.1 putative GntR family transcriptional regulator [Shimwellia blattae DSM 4481 = NBRC 105725]VDY65881.1 Pyruvate dehydrogenase complex repressor [Shimwellia blattae]VEC26138.1 Pyruvate dehydrogenase complex repressor [Shimwellia blattae]
MKVTQGSVSESITRHLAGRILHGQLAPGLSLPGENELAAEYAASRTSVRNALQTLAAKGLVSIQAKKRSTVAPREQWNLLDIDVLGWLSAGQLDYALVEQLMVTRLIFEPNIATLAALHANAGDLAEMEQALLLMRAGQENHRRAQFESGDIAFHHALLQATHNPFLVSLGNALSAAMALSFRRTAEQDLSQTREAVDEHYRLFEAVRFQQPEQARQHMRTILLNAARKHIWQTPPGILRHIL